jgi:hypothetical protein
MSLPGGSNARGGKDPGSRDQKKTDQRPDDDREWPSENSSARSSNIQVGQDANAYHGARLKKTKLKEMEEATTAQPKVPQDFDGSSL